MFGSTVLVPFLTGLDPAIALITSGIGTLTFILITKGQMPSYLGSSFAFIAPIIAAKASGGPGAAMMGAFLAGLVYSIVAIIIKRLGSGWIMKLLPSVVVGPVIMVIGLGLAATAVNMAMNDADGKYSLTNFFSCSRNTCHYNYILHFSEGAFFSIIPVLLGIIGGYAFAYTQGLVDFSKKVIDAKWFAVPDFTIPFF
ncbi:hypothetical protein GCM10020331_046150 [Ectobacillus funiculus]